MITIGDFAGVDDLLDSAAQLPVPGDVENGESLADAPSAATDAGPFPRCGAAASAYDAASAAVPLATGSVDGAPTEVWRIAGPSETRLVAFDADCSVVGARPAP
jgi:hypothetical protein